MKKQLGKHVIYFIIAAALAFLIVIPILTVFLEAVTVNGRLDFLMLYRLSGIAVIFIL